MAEGYTDLRFLWDGKHWEYLLSVCLFFLKDQFSLPSSLPTGTFHEIGKGLMHNIKYSYNHLATNSVSKNLQVTEKKQSHQYFFCFQKENNLKANDSSPRHVNPCKMWPSTDLILFSLCFKDVFHFLKRTVLCAIILSQISLEVTMFQEYQEFKIIEISFSVQGGSHLLRN